jgi:O-antigen/teichoic acid export membrane protein
MNAIKNFLKNASLLIISQTIAMALGFSYMMYMARYIGVKGFGEISFALTFASFLGILIDFGLSSIVTRDVARDKSIAGSYIGNIIIFKLVFLFTSVFLIVILSKFAHYNIHSNYIIFLVTLSVMLASISLSFSSIFQAIQRMEYLFIANILNSVVMFVGVITVAEQNWGIEGIGYLYLLAAIFGVIINYLIYVKNFKKFDFYLNYDLLRKLLDASYPLFISGLIYAFSLKLDVVMLLMLKGDLAVGYYSGAYKIIELLMFIPAIVGTAILPILSNLYTTSQKSIIKYYKYSFECLLIIGLPLTFGIYSVAERIIYLIYGDEFHLSIIALQILIWAIPFIYLSLIINIFLISINKQNIILKFNLFSVTVNIILNLILIPRFGFIGASFCAVITSIILFALEFKMASKYIVKYGNYRFILKLIVSSVMVSLYIMYSKNVNILLLAINSIVIYIALLFVLKLYTKKDINMIRAEYNINICYNK